MTTTEKLFWKHVDKSGIGDNDCWLWTGKVSASTGYGHISIDGVYHAAHRLSWALANRKEVPEGMFICHHCDVRMCVRPDHLYAGTIYDNNRDAFNRRRNARGEMIKASHLTADDVIKIRAEYWGGERLIPLGEKYGVTFRTISNIVTGYTWKHVPMPAGEQPRRQGGGGKKRLTKDAVIAIRKAWDAGKDPNDISSDFDIHPTHVALIGHRKVWHSI